MRTTTYLAMTVLAFALAGAAAAPAFADVQGNDTFRVAGLGRYQTLKLMNGPAEWSGVQIELPANACNLRATGVSQGYWLQVSYRAGNGYDYTGWVDARYLQVERAAPPVDVYAGYATMPDYGAYAPPQQDYAPVYDQRAQQRHDEAAWRWWQTHSHRNSY